MSDELKEVIEHNPQLRRRRPRGKFVADYRKLAEEQAETIKQLKETQERLMNLLTSGQVGSGNPLAQFLPPKPRPVGRRTGYQYLISRIPENEHDDNEKLNTMIRIVPERPDNPDEPDPRYCAFCGVNVCETYGRKDIPGNPNDEQMGVIAQCFVLHNQDVMGKAASKRKGAAGKEDRRFAADHLEMKAIKFGRLPDEVAFLKGRSWTAAEWNERKLKEWEAKCRSVGAGMAQGGI